MSSRMRKKRNQRHNNAMSRKTTASLLKIVHGPTGCMYGVHSFVYRDHGHDGYWTKTCVAVNHGIPCDATYQVHGAELAWVKEQTNVTIYRNTGNTKQ